MWRFRHSFLVACTISHVVLVGFGYPLIYETFTEWLPEWSRVMNSSAGWVAAMFGYWGLPIVAIGMDLVLFLAPPMSVAAIYGIVRRLLPETSRSIFGSSIWLTALVLIASTYLTLQLLVTGHVPTPIVGPVDLDTVKTVPLALHGLGLAGSLTSAALFALLVRRGARAKDAQAV